MQSKVLIVLLLVALAMCALQEVAASANEYICAGSGNCWSCCQENGMEMHEATGTWGKGCVCEY